jgi:hypothetical protein
MKRGAGKNTKGSTKRTKREEGAYAPMRLGFEPIIGDNPHTLILGMFPSEASRAICNYSLFPLLLLSYVNSRVLRKAREYLLGPCWHGIWV